MVTLACLAILLLFYSAEKSLERRRLLFSGTET